MKIGFVNRLHERGWVDRWAFLTFAFAGIIGIPLAKAAGITAIPVAAVALVVMCLFAAIQDRSGTGRVRSDQAGDNCYYLGLVYTLASLAYTIFTFDPGDPASTIVQGFGIALATTIVGLVLRVFFNQSRTDLVEVEDTTRIELADAAARLKAELSQVTVSMNDFGRQIQQSLEEMRTASVEAVSDASAAATASIRDVASEASAGLQAHNTELAASLRKVRNATERAAEGFEAQAPLLSQLEQSARSLGEVATTIREIGDGTRSSLVTMSDQLSQLAGAQSSMHSSNVAVNESMERLSSVVTALSTTLDAVDRRTTERLEALRSSPPQGVQEAAEAVKLMIEELQQRLEQLLSTQAQAAEAMAAEVGRAKEATERHNDALEAELERSRGLVTKVHGALVEMTSELVDQVERRVST